MNNPMFSEIKKGEQVVTNENCATYKGITAKTIFFLALAIISALVTCVTCWNWAKEGSENIGKLAGLLVGGSIVGFISVMIGRSNPRASKFAGAIYAVCEGMFLGVISLIGEIYYSGIVPTAAISTVVVFCVMLALFASGVIRNKSKFMSFGISFGSTLIVMCLVTMVLRLVGVNFMDNIGLVILVEGLFMIYGCVALLMNFIEANALVQGGFSKDYEWSCALGLLVTVLYIYIQILRILLYIYQLVGKNN